MTEPSTNEGSGDWPAWLCVDEVVIDGRTSWTPCELIATDLVSEAVDCLFSEVLLS